MFSKQDQIQGYDDALLAAMNAEEQRHEYFIDMLSSEIYTSKRVMEAQGSGLTNKYAEGYPGKRYYGGCEHEDKVEVLPSSAPSNCSAPTMPTCSRTPVRPPTVRCTWRC